MATKSPLQDKVILAVDDEPDVLEMLHDLLEMCHVVGMTSYDEAIGYLNANNPDLVILDIMGVNGFELLEHCVEKGIPAVMLTAHAFNLDTLKRSIDMGARAYFPKEKVSELVPFLEEVVNEDRNETWRRLFERLGEFFNATFGSDWERHVIDTGPFIVTR
ncbi:MAG: response regulator [Desulfobacteraceae bacterium]